VTEEELDRTAALVNTQITSILRSRARLRGIEEQIGENVNEPFEQDLIYGRHYGTRPGEPRRRVIHGVEITTRVLHQTGIRLSDIDGADLIYEIPGEKYVLIQYKKTDKRGRVTRDQAQLDRLIGDCGHCHSPWRLVRSWCGSWYCVINRSEEALLPACRAADAFGTQKSADWAQFSLGISHPSFDELFAKCYLGARVGFKPVATMIDEAMLAQRLVFMVTEGV
jgi:hypothetical protein